MGSLQLTRRSNRSWGDEEEEEVDPFAELEDDFATDSYEENLRRDRRAAKQASVERLVARLEGHLPPPQLREVSEELVSYSHELSAHRPSYLRSRTHHQTCSSNVTLCRTGACLRE